MRTTLFIDPEDINLDVCYDLKIDCAEIHCGTLCRLYEMEDKKGFDLVHQDLAPCFFSSF